MSPTSGGERVGRYTLYEEIAQGGMASIYLARATLEPSARLYAIKRLHPHLAKDPAFVTTLLDEARATEAVRHRNVVSTVDVVASNGELMIVMDYVVGETVASLIEATSRAGETIPPTIAAAILVDVLTGLHAAHEAVGANGEPLQLIHRDVTPRNVFVREDGTAQVLDFGIAKARGSLNTTREGQLKGTLTFLAPEQVRGREPTRRVDVYAAGCVLWEILAGRPLFSGANEGEIIEKILFEEVAPPSTATSGISPALDAVVMRALSRSPDARFESAEAFARALSDAVTPASPAEVAALLSRACGPALDRKRTRAKEIETVGVALPKEAEDPPAAAPGRARGRAVVWVGIGAALFACGAVGYSFWPRSPAPLTMPSPEVEPSAAPAAASASPAPVEAPPPAASPAPAAPTPANPSTRVPPPRIPSKPVSESCVEIAPDGTKRFDRACLKRKAQ